MKTTYNGACMALPEEDDELFAQINAKTAQRRQKWEAEAARYFDNVYADREREPEARSRELDLSKVLPWVAAVAAMLAGILLGRMM